MEEEERVFKYFRNIIDQQMARRITFLLKDLGKFEYLQYSSDTIKHHMYRYLETGLIDDRCFFNILMGKYGEYLAFCKCMNRHKNSSNAEIITYINLLKNELIIQNLLPLC